MLDFRPQLSAINGANLDAVVRFVATSLEDAERLLRLQHEATRKLFAGNVEAFRAMVDPAGNGTHSWNGRNSVPTMSEGCSTSPASASS